MKKTGVFLVVIFALASFMVLTTSQKSEAVPSFARQLKKPCTACHTIWPDLNQYGRQFKVKGYTDASPDWGVIKKDRLDLFTVFPISFRAIVIPWVQETDSAAGQRSNHSELDDVNIFIAGRIFKYMGIFTHTTGVGSQKIGQFKLVLWHPVAHNSVGLVLSKSFAAGADPFSSLGGWDRALVSDDQESVPWPLAKGWTASFWSSANYGATLDGYFLGNRLYAAIAAMRGGDPADAAQYQTAGVNGGPLFSIGANNGGAGTPFTSPDVTGNPLYFYGRLAWDQKLSNGAVTFGSAYYGGHETVLDSNSHRFQTSVQREYVDASLEQEYGMDHMVLARALYGWGQETGLNPIIADEAGAKYTLGPAAGGAPDDKRSFNGGAIEASYFFKRTYGITSQWSWVSNSHVQINDWDPGTHQRTWAASLTYLPMLNTKIMLIYAQVKSDYLTGGTTSLPSETDNIYKMEWDIAF